MLNASAFPARCAKRSAHDPTVDRETTMSPLSNATAASPPATQARNPLSHIPGEDGWPLVGNSLKLIGDPIGYIEAGYRKYGLVWRDRAFGYRGVALLGPDANELVFADRAKNFSSAGGWNMVFERVFPRGLMMMDFDEHRLHRRAMGVAFQPAPMRAYLRLLHEGIQQRVPP